ncbi:competence type IV pilus assembly protein ComGB [Oceanobacillus sp. CAU 1775]
MHMASSMKRPLIKYRKNLSEQIQLRFLKRLHRLINSGYPLLECLEIMKWDKDLTQLANQFIHALRDGKPIHMVFEENKFHESICTFVYFTKVSSNLNESIQKCIEMFEHKMTNNKKFNQAIRYPLILLFVFSLTLFFINQQVLPSFQTLLQSSPQAKQTITILILMMDLLQFTFITFAITIVVGVMVWRIFRGRIPINKQLKILNRIPIYRNYLRLQTSFQFATHFSSLLKAGLSLKQTLNELSKHEKLPIIKYYADLITLDLNRGFHLSILLSELPFLEKQLVAIFQKNNDIQSLENDLSIYSEVLMEEIHRKILSMITLIQPIFYIILACFIVFIYISLLWPMFQLINTF